MQVCIPNVLTIIRSVRKIERPSDDVRIHSDRRSIPIMTYFNVYICRSLFFFFRFGMCIYRRLYCSNCLTKTKDRLLCKRCVVFTTRPLSKIELLKLKAKDLIFYLQSKHISTTGCVGEWTCSFN